MKFLINLKVIEKETLQAWCLLFIIWGGRKCFVRKLCCKGQHPPWCYPILFGLCCYYQVQRTIIISHFCEYVIVYLLGRVYQVVKIMTLPRNKNQKKIRRGRRKEKNFLTQVMFKDEHEQFQKEQMLRLYTNCYTSVFVLMVSMCM